MSSLNTDLYNPRLLLVDSYSEQSNELVQAFQKNGIQVSTTDTAQKALDHLQQTFSDVLLLEIPMPDMSAAQAVAVARNRFPFLPIVILAEKERLNDAIGALNAGAIHVLPLPCEPLQAISDLRKILVFSHEAMQPSRVFPGLKQTIRFEIPSSLDNVTGTANQLIEMLVRYGIIGIEELNIKIAIVEALTNAMEHGHGFNPDMRVQVEAKIDERKAEIKISDGGKGFNHRELPNPTAPENLYKPRGRGIYMMHRLMDEVHFNRKGNNVRLVKYRRKPFESNPT